MPKQKTHRGAAKRFALTGTGKVKRARANKSHYANYKPSKRKRRLRMGGLVFEGEQRTIKKLIPYK